ncbi:hypothetical protein BO71DRAFT_54156 [Aspergillus ellipticus CBS 707.79]|uniref:Uncharacterized protein n=1 Tax=Aspergillus ellipticus CBS 707.79 TaxID=1448320 RepID=A0A319D9X5_9EURO|nr:hypothetical protein BO71DRAFT_54156 [Aspergillus ellipticus CBS 707.79]
MCNPLFPRHSSRSQRKHGWLPLGMVVPVIPGATTTTTTKLLEPTCTFLGPGKAFSSIIDSGYSIEIDFNMFAKGGSKSFPESIYQNGNEMRSSRS